MPPSVLNTVTFGRANSSLCLSYAVCLLMQHHLATLPFYSGCPCCLLHRQTAAYVVFVQVLAMLDIAPFPRFSCSTTYLCSFFDGIDFACRRWRRRTTRPPPARPVRHPRLTRRARTAAARAAARTARLPAAPAATAPGPARSARASSASCSRSRRAPLPACAVQNSGSCGWLRAAVQSAHACIQHVPCQAQSLCPLE